MEYKKQLIELRKQLPVPIAEAVSLLQMHGGNVDACVEAFKAQRIDDICQATGCSSDMASEFYAKEKFDFNRTVSAIREVLYDQNYHRPEGLTKDGLDAISDWIYLVESHDFPTALDYIHLVKAINTLALLPRYKDAADALLSAKAIKEKIFEGYSNSDSMEEFVRRHQRIDDDIEFQKKQSYCVQKLTLIKEELARHKRNIAK